MKKVVKSLLGVLLFALALSLAPQARAQSAESEALAAQPGLNQCSASAYCPQSGRTVSCTVFANALLGQTCTWESRWAYGVRCTGYDTFGRWAVYQDYCP